jgi:heme oxygenase
MSLKEITKEVHQAAEETKFMRSVFKKQMPTEVWRDYTYNKMLWYGAIECKARAEGLLNDLPGIERAYYLYQDYKDLNGNADSPKFTPASIEYHRYILDLEPGKVLAHLYTWHMGDLFGGQMIKKMLDTVPHRNLEFKDVDALKTTLRAKLDDSLGDEANCAFDWAIRIMNSYNDQLPSNE